MATIKDPQIIRVMLENEGVYPGDPPMERIYQYKGMSGERLFAIFEDEHWDDMHASPYVMDAQLLFDHRIGLTKIGRQVLDQLKEEAPLIE